MGYSLKVWGFKFRVEDLSFKGSGLFRHSGLRFRGLRFAVSELSRGLRIRVGEEVFNTGLAIGATMLAICVTTSVDVGLNNLH